MKGLSNVSDWSRGRLLGAGHGDRARGGRPQEGAPLGDAETHGARSQDELKRHRRRSPPLHLPGGMLRKVA